jgi:methylthioribulose-1-phosphate dehydratase
MADNQVAVADGHENNDHLVQSTDPEHPANLIPEMCRKFYTWGWVTGTGGGVGIHIGCVWTCFAHEIE